MGYQFKGIFCDGDSIVMEAILDQWPICTGRVISESFSGFGIRCPDPDLETDTDEEYDALDEQVFAFEQAIEGISSEFHNLLFVYVHADCFGGTCVYRGFVARDGRIQDTVDSVEPGFANLKRLLAPLGVQSVDPFPPFVRGYWEEHVPSASPPVADRRRQKNMLLVALLAFTAISSAMWVFVPDGSPNERLLYVAQSFGTVLLVLLWCHVDSSQRSYRLSKKLSILIVLVAVVGLPIYLLKSRGRRGGSLAILKALAFYGLMYIVDYLSFEAAYSAHVAATGQGSDKIAYPGSQRLK